MTEGNAYNSLALQKRALWLDNTLHPFLLPVSCMLTSVCFTKQKMKESLNVLKEMFSVQQATIELWMHTGGLLSTQEARVALGYRFVRLLATFVRSNLPRASITRWLHAKHYLIMEHI